VAVLASILEIFFALSPNLEPSYLFCMASEIKLPTYGVAFISSCNLLKRPCNYYYVDQNNGDFAMFSAVAPMLVTLLKVIFVHVALSLAAPIPHDIQPFGSSCQQAGPTPVYSAGH